MFEECVGEEAARVWAAAARWEGVAVGVLSATRTSRCRGAARRPGQHEGMKPTWHVARGGDRAKVQLEVVLRAERRSCTPARRGLVQAGQLPTLKP